MSGEWDAALSWLHARLDDEERVAKAAAAANGLRWEGSEGGIYHADDPYGWTSPFIDDAADGFLDPQLAEHIARHDPTAVLRRVESDRRLLEWMQRTYDIALDANLWTYDEWEPLKIMALRYVDAPNFPEVLRMDEDATT